MAESETGLGEGAFERKSEAGYPEREDGSASAVPAIEAEAVHGRNEPPVIHCKSPWFGRVVSRQRFQNGFVKSTGKKPKKWVGYWYEYRVAQDGTEKRCQRTKILGAQAELTRTEAKEALRKHIHGAKTETDSTFEVAAANYIDLKRGDWSRKNREVMESLFKQHIIPGIGKLIVKDIKQTDLKRWINAVGGKYSYSITHKCLTHVRAIFDQLVEDDVVLKNPARSKKQPVRIPKTKKSSERFLQLEECHRLLDVATDPRDHLILRILMGCALRPSETFALQLRDVESGRLRIDEAVVLGEVGDTKTEESDGYVPLSPGLQDEFSGYIFARRIDDPKAYLFPSKTGTPYDPKNYLNRHLKPLAKKAGVPGVNFQVFRRTAATHSQNYGAKVKDTQALLRHANATVTLKHYQKSMEPSLLAAVDGWDKALTGDRKVVEIRPKRSA
jgi:integrase